MAQREYTYTRQDIAEILGTTPNAVSQHVTRGRLTMSDLRSVILYVAEYAEPSFREQIIRSLSSTRKPFDPGGWKKKAKKVSKPQVKP
ncbi:MAG TPA: hypothetical protein DD670_20805 [Planctomycetaceae bacterium]|nr:hypothetical protein [Planctomycetaceae bacterium]